MKTKKYFPDSELIINGDGSIFHLHLKPEQLSDKIILVGDPARVTMVAQHFDTIECEVSSREFHTITGYYKGKRITVQSHGIGPDNLDIVLNELDALANIDFATRTEKENFTQLTLVRIGTSGGLQPECPTGSFVVAARSIGFDGVLNYYTGRNEVVDLEFEQAFKESVGWSALHCSPYVISADKELVDRIAKDDMIRGVTISAIGFYGPQGRELRIPLAEPQLNSKIEAFSHHGTKITNYEMESSVLAGLGKLMGHKAMTVCAIIANRVAQKANSNYKASIEDLVKIVLERL